MKKLIGLMGCILSISFLSGCTTPAYFSLPTQRFESPTVAGEAFKFGIGGGVSNRVHVVTVKDIDATPPDSSGSVITRDPNDFVSSFTFIDKIIIDARLGLLPALEISSTGNLYSLKFQFLGSPRSSASDGLVGSLLVDVISSGQVKSSGDLASNTYKLSVSGTGGSLILGYRKADVIYYLNFNKLSYKADTTVTQSSTVYEYSGEGEQTGAIFGIRKESDKGMYAALEWAYTDTSWKTLDKMELGTVGAIFGYGW